MAAIDKFNEVVEWVRDHGNNCDHTAFRIACNDVAIRAIRGVVVQLVRTPGS